MFSGQAKCQVIIKFEIDIFLRRINSRHLTLYNRKTTTIEFACRPNGVCPNTELHCARSVLCSHEAVCLTGIRFDDDSPA